MTDLNKLRAALQAKQPSSAPPPPGASLNDLSIAFAADVKGKRVFVRINKSVSTIALDPAQVKSMITNLVACGKEIGINITQELKWD